MHVSSDKKTRVSEVESDLDLEPNTHLKTTYIYLSTENSHTSKIEQLVDNIITT